MWEDPLENTLPRQHGGLVSVLPGGNSKSSYSRGSGRQDPTEPPPGPSTQRTADCDKQQWDDLGRGQARRVGCPAHGEAPGQAPLGETAAEPPPRYLSPDTGLSYLCLGHAIFKLNLMARFQNLRTARAHLDF